METRVHKYMSTVLIITILICQEITSSNELQAIQSTNDDLNPIATLSNTEDRNKSLENSFTRVKRQYGYYDYDPYYRRRYPPYPLPIIVGLGGFGVGPGLGFGRGFGGRGFGGRGVGGRGFGGRGIGGRGIGGRGIGGRGGIGGGRGGGRG